MPNISRAARVDWVDHARGICIILVVMMHSVLGVAEDLGSAGYMGAVVDFARPFRMPDFFLISGLFLSRVLDRDWRTFADRRILHFVYFYVLWLAIQFAFKAPGMVAEGGVVETAGLLVKSLLWEPFGTLWFIWMLPVFALTVRLTRGLHPGLVLGAAIGLQVAPVATGVQVVDEFAARFVYYYVGYLAAPFVFAAARRVAERPLVALAGIATWALVNGGLVAAGMADLPLVSLALGFAGAGAVVAVAALLERAGTARALAFLGRHSIVVYLAFFLPMALSREVLVRLGLFDAGTTGLLVTAAGVVGPLVIWWLSLKVGARFLFERPAWARIERRPARLAPAE